MNGLTNDRNSNREWQWFETRYACGHTRKRYGFYSTEEIQGSFLASTTFECPDCSIPHYAIPLFLMPTR